MKRIINTFKYGSVGVKLTLLATIICGLATAGLLACAIIFRQLIWFFAFIFAGFITVSLAQTFAIQGGIEEDDNAVGVKKTDSQFDDYYDEDDDFDEDEQDYDFSYAELPEMNNGNRLPDSASEIDYLYDEDDEDIREKKKRKQKEKKDKTKKTKIKKKKIKKHKKTKTAIVNKKALIKKPKKVAIRKDIPKVVKVASIDIDYKAMVKKDIKDSKKDMAKKEALLAEEEKELNESDIVSDEEYYDESGEDGKRSKNFVPEPITAETVKQYNIKRIRKTLHKYKVKRDHKLAIIDRCETYNISQTPAYIWVDGNDFHILLIEKEPRHLVLSTFKVGRIKYLKKQPVDINLDYEVFNTKSMVTDLFRPYLPDYNQSNVDSDLNYYKNLYGIGPGIYFTNNSAKQLIDFFGFGMDVDDKVTESKRVNLYFKDAYKANIMVRDNVLDANGYADRISSILEEMAASNLSYNEFKETLNLMIKNKFITKEFGMYYMEVRDKKHS